MKSVSVAKSSLFQIISKFFSKKNLQLYFIAVATLLLSLLSYFRVFEVYELQTYDWRCQLRGARPVSSDIVMIDIADDTLSNIGAWPFSREYHSALIDVLNEHGAAAVIFDILFVEARPEEDAIVAKSAKEANNVYFAYAFTEPQRTASGFVAESYLAPLVEAYEASAKRTGYINVVADIDGKRRKIVPMLRHQDKDHFHISLEAAMDALGVDRQKVFIDPSHRLNLSDKLRIPLDEEGYMPINFAGRWEETFQHYSYYHVLYAQRQIYENEKPILDLSKLKGKICIVGHTATATHDANATPLEPIYPNVGIHANILNSILKQDFISRAGRLWNVLILLFLTAWIGWTVFNKSLLVSFLRSVLILILFISTIICVFIQWGFWVDLFLPAAAAILIYAVATLNRTFREMHKRESMEKELKIASQIQMSFLPEKAPEEPGIEIAVYMKPAKEVGGDLYSFLKLGDEKVGVMVGDVSGKGTPAALFMAKVVSEFKFSAHQKSDPANVLLSLNDSVASESTGGLFVTMTYAVFDLKERKLFLSNGGHLPVVAVSQEGKSELLSVEEGMPIGVLPGVSFGNFTRPIHPEDVFAFYSDGVSEARNKKQEEYSIEKLQALLSQYRVLSAQRILEKSVADLNKFMGKAEQHDDITLIIVKIIAKP